MRRCSILHLNLTFILSLAFSGTLSGILIPSPGTTSASSAPGAAPGDVSPDLAPRRVKRERRHDRKQQNRKQDRIQKDRKKDRERDRSGAAGSGQSVEDRYIVVLEPGAGNPTRVASAVASDSADITVTHVYEHVLNGFAAVIPDDQLDDVRNDPRVQSVVPDREVHAFDQNLPTGINRIDADRNPTAKIDGINEQIDVDVAVLDSGIGPHSDLNIAGGINVISVDGRNTCDSGNTNYADDNDHGTHVAGTIGALDNDTGVVGVAPGARLWAVKVLDSNGDGWWSDVNCGLDWVVDNSGTIDVVNMSLGGGAEAADHNSCGPTTTEEHNAICRVVDAGIPVVVAAGNGDDQGRPIDAALAVPAAYDEVITVSALADSDGRPGRLGPATTRGPDDSLASFSNFGADVDIAAPGVSILSAVPGGYDWFSGTSMAAPHVAGAAALYLADHSDATPAEVKATLLNTRETIPMLNDRDGINEGVLYVGDGVAPTGPIVNPVTPADSAATPSDGKKSKDKKKHKKGKDKHKKKRR